MNQITWLESSIAAVELMVSEDREKLSQNPDSFSARLVLASTEGRLADLQRQLRLEKEKRGREVVDFKLINLQGVSGTIPLNMLAKVAKELSDAVHAAAYYIKYGKDLISKVPERLERELDLRLAGLEFGSTRLIISSETSPNLFGQSTAEDAFSAIFDVVQSDGDDEITAAVAASGMKASRSIARLCDVILKEKAAVEMRWDTPSGQDRVFKGAKDRLNILSATLMDLTVIPPKELNVTGTLDLVGVKGQFEIRSCGKKYPGRYPETLFEKVRGIPIGSTVDAVINKEIIENKATGYTKESFSLIDICKREKDS